MSFLITLLLLLSLTCGCTRTPVQEQVRTLGKHEFTPQKWAVAAPVEREQMLRSFFAQYPADRLTVDQVNKLLGAPTGYYDYDENRAYVVGPATVESMYGKERMLVFITDRRSGEIVKIEFVPALP